MASSRCRPVRRAGSACSSPWSGTCSWLAAWRLRRRRSRVRAESGPPAAVRPARSAPPQSLPLPMGCLHALGRSAQRAQPQERVQRRVDAPLACADRPIQERSADRVPRRPVHRSVGAVLINEAAHAHARDRIQCRDDPRVGDRVAVARAGHRGLWRQAVRPFAQALVGIVYTRSTFMMSGSDVQYTHPFTGGVLLFTSGGFPPDRSIVRAYTTRPNKIAESDRSRLGDVSRI